jgi:hypothetical protein
MKISNIKLSLRILVLAFGFVILLMPKSASARTENEKFCAKVGSISQQMLSKMESKKHPVILEKTLNEDKISSLRAKSDAKREESYSKLYQKYSSETQKIAIDEYKTSIDNAINLRRQKTDLARENFISEVNKLASNHYQTVSLSENKVITAVQAASDLAASQCADGLNPAQVSASFKQSLISAKSGFRIDKAELESKKLKIDSLLNTRKQAIDSASQEFRASVQAAKEKLLTSLR